MADFWQRARKINTIELINQDPLLSEFKYHFMLQGVHMDKKMVLEEFAEHIPEGFGLQNTLSNSVYIAQIIDKYEGDLFDITIGFRRDETAIQIARGSLKFTWEGKEYMVGLTKGFRIFMEELRQRETQNNEEYPKNNSDKKSDIHSRLQSKEESEQPRHTDRVDQSRNKSRSRSRSRQKHRHEHRSASKHGHSLKRHKSSKY